MGIKYHMHGRGGRGGRIYTIRPEALPKTWNSTHRAILFGGHVPGALNRARRSPELDTVVKWVAANYAGVHPEVVPRLTREYRIRRTRVWVHDHDGHRVPASFYEYRDSRIPGYTQ